MEHHSQGSDLLRAMKARADELQAQAKAAGEPLKRGVALETAAHERGFRNWNAAAAAAKSSQANRPLRAQPLWRELDRALPELPMRFYNGPSRFYEGIKELMRRAKQVELIAVNVPKEARQEMLSLIGGPLPYVFEQSASRWGDDLFRLCDRGYDPWKGFAFTREQLADIGVDQWNEEFGSHDGRDALSVTSDDVTMSTDAQTLRRLARLLASIALMADAVYARQEEAAAPVRASFQIDLNDPAQFTTEGVARLLASKDDSEHRQLRITQAGIAYLSDVVGNNDMDGLAFQLETWAQGNGYVGTEAAEDADWVGSVFQMLRKNWPDPQASVADW